MYFHRLIKISWRFQGYHCELGIAFFVWRGTWSYAYSLFKAKAQTPNRIMWGSVKVKFEIFNFVFYVSLKILPIKNLFKLNILTWNQNELNSLIIKFSLYILLNYYSSCIIPFFSVQNSFKHSFNKLDMF